MANANEVQDDTATNVNNVNELICFIQQRSNVMAFDHLAELCSSFYNSDEIKTALTIVMKAAGSHVLSYKGPVKDKKCVTDIIKTCLDPNIQLPAFVALRLDRLPPVDVNHVDVSALLQELSLLRFEVKVVAQLREEIVELRNSMDCLKAQCLSDTNYVSYDKNFLSLQQDNRPSTFNVLALSSFAADLHRDDFRIVNHPVTKKNFTRKIKSVVGKATNQKLTSVSTRRNVDIFVSRLHPLTETADIIECVTTVVPSLDCNDIQCEKLKSKYVELYSSFYVCVRVDADKMKQMLDVLMSEESWPAGLLVRRYFKKRDG